MNSIDENFIQEGPQAVNGYSGHGYLRSYLKAQLPDSLFKKWDSEFNAFADRCRCEYQSLSRQAEREAPTHVPFDPWGRRIDELRVSKAWSELEKASAREGLVAMAFEQKEAEFSRLLQFVKLFLFHPHSAFFTCPLAMTDGAARILKDVATSGELKDVYSRLTSRDPEKAWTSGQWMTEKTGGSDVSLTSTVARKIEGAVALYGTKWFSSATTSAVALALARYEDAPAGSKGLTLFLVPTYSAPGTLNNIEILRLKDKLGTKALPTAELKLIGARAIPVSEPGQGVKTVATMLNITRLYNSVCAIGQTAYALNLLHEYAAKRTVFSKTLSSQPLYQTTFVEAEIKQLAGFLLTFDMVARLGREETDQATDEDSEILRLFTPITKMFTAKMAVEVTSEVVEGFGGAGYVEDTGIPKLLRDAQVFPIWEGATHVLALDVVRAIGKGRSAEVLEKEFESVASLPMAESFKPDGLHFLKQFQAWLSAPEEIKMAEARSMAFSAAWFYAAILLLKWSSRSDEKSRSQMKSWLSFMVGRSNSRRQDLQWVRAGRLEL